MINGNDITSLISKDFRVSNKQDDLMNSYFEDLKLIIFAHVGDDMDGYLRRFDHGS